MPGPTGQTEKSWGAKHWDTPWKQGAGHWKPDDVQAGDWGAAAAVRREQGSAWYQSSMQYGQKSMSKWQAKPGQQDIDDDNLSDSSGGSYREDPHKRGRVAEGRGHGHDLNRGRGVHRAIPANLNVADLVENDSAESDLAESGSAGFDLAECEYGWAEIRRRGRSGRKLLGSEIGGSQTSKPNFTSQ